MKLVFIFSMMLSSTFTFAGSSPDKLICSIKNSKSVIAVAERHSDYDKNRHCTVSCMLSLRCNLDEVMLIGVLKEIKDVFGPGNAERADLVADKFGIDLVRHQRARTDSECLDQCDLRYR
jgi:hypothetical protein